MIRFALKAVITGILVMGIVFFGARDRFSYRELLLLGGLIVVITFVLDYCHGLISIPLVMEDPMTVVTPISNSIQKEEEPRPVEKEVEDWEHEVPFMFLSATPEVPVPNPPVTAPYSELKGITGRWIGWGKLMRKNTKPLNANTHDYKMFYGYYAEEIAESGFNDPILPGNEEQNQQLAPKDYPTNNPLDQAVFGYTMPQNFELTGGGNPDDTTPTTKSTIATSKVANVATTSTLGSLLHPNNTEMGLRLTNVVYSGDLVDMLSGADTLQRDANSSRVVIKPQLPDIGTNLSKLHFDDLSSSGKGNPIIYNDPIRIGHVALINNANKVRYIKYGERVQSHQEGPQYAIFRLVHAVQPNIQSVVKYGDKFKIACGYQQGDKTFLKTEADGSLSSESTIDQATLFHLTLLKPYNSRQNNLCVCPNESIFP
jgi:hypothetical protein